MFRAALTTLLVCAAALSVSDADPLCKNDGFFINGYCYWLAPLKVIGSWSDAGRDCRYLNAHLFRPSSQENMEDISSLIIHHYNTSEGSNEWWAIDSNLLLDPDQWLNTDFSVPRYNTIHPRDFPYTEGYNCGVLRMDGNNTAEQYPTECESDMKALCQKKVCASNETMPSYRRKF